ncbi:MAG: hypothetical protein AAGA54_28095 [Myxococcota bacterium]
MSGTSTLTMETLGRTPRTSRGVATTLVALCAALGACTNEGDAGETEASSTGAADVGGEVGSDESSGEPFDPDAQYAVSVRVQGMPLLGYVTILNSPRQAAEVDLAEVIEIPNAGLAVGSGQDGVMYLVDGTTPRLTEFLVDPDGGVTQGRTLSMEAFSPSSAGARAGNFIFVSNTKAYVIDTFTKIVGVWNPETFEITGTFDIDEAGLAGWIGVVGGAPRSRDGEFIYAQSFVSLTSSYAPTSNVVFLDPETDSIAHVTEIPDCTAVSELVVADNGDIWGASDVSAVFNQLTGLSDGDECIFRIPAGSYEVDEYMTFPQRTGGLRGGTLLQQQDTQAYVRILDEALAPANPTDIGDINGAQVWRWGRLDLATDEPIEVLTDLPPMAGSTRAFTLDGTSWATEGSADLATATMLDLSGAAPAPGFEVTGIIINAFRLR